MSDKQQKNQLQMVLAFAVEGGVKLRRLDGKGPNRSRRTAKLKARLDKSSGWKRSAAGRT